MLPNLEILFFKKNIVYFIQSHLDTKKKAIEEIQRKKFQLILTASPREKV
jgi:hypothetical protein